MRSLLGITGLAALAGFLFLSGGSAHAQSFSRTLDDIRVTTAGGREVMQLTFSAPVETPPAEEHEPGSFRLRFSATGTTLPNSLFQIREQSAIQDYRVVRNQYATTVAVNLRDPKENLQGRLRIETDGKLLKVIVPGAAAAQGNADQAILAQAERRMAGEPLPGSQAAPQAAPSAAQGTAPLGTGDKPAAFEENWLSTLLTMIVALAIVLGLLYGMVWVYNRFLAGRVAAGRSGGFPIRHLGSYAVGPRQRVVVLDINGEVVACGVTPQNISFLARLGQTRQAAQRRQAQAAATGAAASAPSLAPASSGAPRPPTAGGTEPDPGTDPVHTFAETLKEKVRSLKRLK